LSNGVSISFYHEEAAMNFILLTLN